ncbi:MAG: ribonuclease Y [Anaerolineales bacterium]
MNSNLALILIFVSGILALAIGIAIGYMIKHYQAKAEREKEQAEAGNVVTRAREEAREIKITAENEALEIQRTAEREAGRRRNEITKEEDRLQRRREELDRRSERIERQNDSLNKRQSALDKRANEVDKIYEQQIEELQRISGMTPEEARGVLLTEVEKEARDDMARVIRTIEAEAREEGEERARKLVADAIQRVASDQVSEVTTKVVNLPSDEMKGRIIGRNGRNIQAFEQAAGVDVIVDDTPEAVTISCFDPVRREIARRALEKLVLDGRIHPAYIEKVIKKEEQEVEKIIAEAGEQAAYEAGLSSLHPEITRMMGRLKFRTSYGQNQLNHAVETAKIAGILAAELGADVEISKAAAFLHDIGKAMDHNVEGTHAMIGAEFVRRYGVNPRVVNAIASHHHEVEQETVEAIIVESADAISGARPGARREGLEQYIKRVRALEEIANNHKGVTQSYALQAGREIRIFVRPEDIDDLASTRLARDIAHQIEETMQYPGQIKVTVIRETRAIDYAK